MSLATRCPHCKTIFQVSEAQLKLCSGTVRCGVCRNLFNGIDNLIGRLSSRQTDFLPEHLEKANPEISSGNESALPQNDATSCTERSSSVQNELSQSGLLDGIDENEVSDKASVLPNEALKEAFNRQLRSLSLDLNDLPEDDVSLKTPPPVMPALTPDTGSMHKDTLFQPESTGAPETGITEKSEKKEPSETVGKTDTSPSLSSPNDNAGKSILQSTPDIASEDFSGLIYQKKKKTRISAALWGVGIVLLSVILYGQVIYHYSAQIVTWWPPAGNLVQSSCELLSCPVRKPAEPMPLDLVYDGLIAKEGTDDRFIQNVTLANNSSSLQLWPSLILEITDTGNKVLSRKILEPQEYLPEESGFAKGLQPSEKINFQLDIEFRHDSAIHSRVFILTH